MSKPLVARQNIYRTADGEIIFGDGNPRAAFHVARAGSQVPEEWVKAVKAAGHDDPDEPDEPEPTPEPEPTVPDEPAADAAVTEAPDEKDGETVEGKAADTPASKAKKAPAKKTAAKKKAAK